MEENKDSWMAKVLEGDGVPRGYAVEFGTGRLVPLTVPVRVRTGGKRPAVRRG